MADWIVSFIEQYGYLGIAALMLAENLFPPIPSELIMPFAGFVAARGDLSLAGVIGAGVVGTVVGALPWYGAGRAVGSERLERWAERHGRWLTVSAEDLRRAERWFERHGAAAVAFGRLVPAVRSVISAPAGVARMPLHRFLVWTTAGSAVWVTVLTTLGLMLEGRYEQVEHWLNPVATGVVLLAGAVYLFRLLRARRG
ncbi:MAG TPA: DedA family protein [Methylibium sp.]|uniref:DedA family protein n=1 Tax=Methylibium sp. TaxID=2067992 RepID=UPI002DB57221|nr:DedA family protein [Methylibium sp.]HEU4460548.1 DedA family protein [Methylibium sp.]